MQEEESGGRSAAHVLTLTTTWLVCMSSCGNMGRRGCLGRGEVEWSVDIKVTWGNSFEINRPLFAQLEIKVQVVKAPT